MKIFARIVLILAGVGLAVLAYLQIAPRSDTRTTYMTGEVVEGTLRETVTATGSVNAVVTVEVGSQLSGRIAALLVDYNDRVSRGQAVARLDPQTYEARKSEAEAALDMARASVAVKQAELARASAELADARANLAVLEARLDGAMARYESAYSDLERKRSLGERNLITSEELRDAELRLKIEAAALKEEQAVAEAHAIKVRVATSNVERQEADLVNARASIPQREALLELAEIELQRTVIRAPIDGIVIRRNVSEGQTVAASLEAPTLFTIAQDLTEMELHARIDETDIGRVKVGQPAEFTVDAHPGRVFEGRVTQIRKAPEVVQNVVTYTVVIETRNDERRLLPGMTANIRVLVMESEPVLKLPLAALAFRPGAIPAADDTGGGPGRGETVWTLDAGGEPRPVTVTTGARDRSHVALAAGPLVPGDRVITNEVTQQAGRSVLGLRIGF